MILSFPEPLPIGLIIDSVSSVTGHPSVSAVNELFTRNFKEDTTFIRNENKVEHSTEAYHGFCCPADMFVSKATNKYLANTIRVKTAGSAYTSIAIQDCVRTYGEEFEYDGRGAPCSNAAYSYWSAYKGVWQRGTYYLIGLTGTNNVSAYGQTVNVQAWRPRLSASICYTFESYFVTHPTTSVYSVLADYTATTLVGSGRLYASTDGILTERDSIGNIIKTWTKSSLYNAALINVSAVCWYQISWSAYHFYQAEMPADHLSKDPMQNCMTKFPSDKKKALDWLRADPLWVTTRWQDSLHRAHNQLSWLLNQCAEGATYTDMNSLQYVRDLLNVRSLFTSLADSAKTLVSSSKAIAKAGAVSSLYLGNRYGTILTYQDTRDLFTVVKNLRGLSPDWKYHTLRSAYTDVGTIKVKSDNTSWTGTARYTAHCKIVYSDPQSPLMAAIKSAFEWDIWPTLQNCWDFIPYSFVVDWALPTDRLLTSIDDMLYIQKLPVRAIVLSTKVESTFSATQKLTSGDYFIGTRSRVDYSRWCEEKIPPINPLLLSDQNTTFHTGTEATALIVQKVASKS